MYDDEKVIYVDSSKTMTKAHEHDVAYDLVYTGKTFMLNPLERALCETNLQKIAVPVGYAALVAPRSGLAIKHGVTVLNAPGVIDPGYRDEVKVILVNLSNTPYEVKTGDRIAQIFAVKLADKFVEAPQEHSVFDPIDNRHGGFGSSGK